MATDQINCMEELLAQSTQIKTVMLDKEIEGRKPLAWIWVAVLASIITSMVVEKRYPFSFRDVEIAVYQEYRACMG